MRLNNHPELSLLKDHNLVGVTFIQNYLQLLMEGLYESPILNGYVWPWIKTDKGIFSIESLGYRDALCEQIGKKLVNVLDNNEEIVLIFSDNAEIHFSIKECDKTGPEAVMLQMGNITCVW